MPGKGQTSDGAFADRGMVIRRWDAVLGGKRVHNPHFSVYRNSGTATTGLSYSSGGASSGIKVALEISPPPGVTTLLPGDYVDASVEFIVLPRNRADYNPPLGSASGSFDYGRSDVIAALSAADSASWSGSTSTSDSSRLGTHWGLIRREAVFNSPNISLTYGTLESDHPVRIRVDQAAQVAYFKLSSGLGHVPFSFSGVTHPSATTNFKLLRSTIDISGGSDQAHRWSAIDYWQTDYDIQQQSFTFTYNVLLDADSSIPSAGWGTGIPSTVVLENLGGSGCTSSAPCSACQGDCDSDSDCAGDLRCFQRDTGEKVPGCVDSEGQPESYDYCAVSGGRVDYFWFGLESTAPTHLTTSSPTTAPTEAPTAVPTSGTEVFSGVVTIQGFDSVESFTPSHQAVFKASLITTLSAASVSELSKEQISLTVTLSSLSGGGTGGRRLAAAVALQVSFTIEGVTSSELDSAGIAVAAIGENGEPFLDALRTAFAVEDATVPYAELLNVVAPTNAPTKAPTKTTSTADTTEGGSLSTVGTDASGDDVGTASAQDAAAGDQTNFMPLIAGGAGGGLILLVAVWHLVHTSKKREKKREVKNAAMKQEEDRLRERSSISSSFTGLAATTGGSGSSALAAGWAETVDPSTGGVYYWNKSTDETSWERPVEKLQAGLPPAQTDAALAGGVINPGQHSAVVVAPSKVLV
jgi:hypothetical protein